MATALRQARPAAGDARRQLDAFLAANQNKSLLRFLTCGSVDDGKSTLIGRLLYDSRMLFEDQLAMLESDSRRQGTQGQKLDFALLVDGLAAEREQGITIDVAYRFFATDRRKFIVADTPGHEQYTRNMATGASTADLAVILIDARKGVLTQTRRHSYIASLLGIRHFVLAVNKMDLVGYSEERFDRIVADYSAFARKIGIADFTPIPLSGLAGDNVAARGEAMTWYRGPSLLEHLETVPVGQETREAEPFRMPVQWVNRPHSRFRGYAGTIAGGSVRVGDKICVLPARKSSTVERIVTADGDLAEAREGQAVTLTFGSEVDCSRGDLVAGDGRAAETADRVAATLVWMADAALVPHRSYLLKIGTQTVAARITMVGEAIDVDTLARKAADTLRLNGIGAVEISLDRPVPAVLYSESRTLGGFILIDRETCSTVAAGMIQGFPRAAASHEHDETGDLLWLAGGGPAARAGYAADLQHRLRAVGRRSIVIDAETMRQGLASDLGEGEEDAAELLRRVREVAKLALSAGTTVIVTLEVDPADAVPGKLIDIAREEIAAGEDWVI